MPSERRRQRQQKVRHEAGDYVPSCPKVAPETTQMGQGGVAPNADPPSYGKVTSMTAPAPPTNQHANGMPRRADDSQRRSDRRRQDAPTSREQGRGKHPPCAAPPKSNVAFADNEIEYEPVRIMESKETEALPKELPQPPKYRRREVISNWVRYEEQPPDPEADISEGEDYLMGEDFSEALLKSQNSSGAGFLHLRGEMSWGHEDPAHLARHGLGALKVASLVDALATIPLYEQLRIPADALPGAAVAMMRGDAERCRRRFQPDREFVTDLELNLKVLESLKLSLQDEEEAPAADDSLEGRAEDQVGRDSVGAALKLAPEGGDPSLSELVLDLADLAGVETPPSREESATPPQKAPSPQRTPDEAPRPKGGFDFGLSKPPTAAPPPQQRPTPTIPPNPATPSNPTPATPSNPTPFIDLDEATPSAPEGTSLPPLVSKTEVEHLEDWLDSVLDD